MNMTGGRKLGWINIIFWLALLLLAAWVIAKILGWIHSPTLVEVFPYISIVFIAGTMWQQFKIMGKDVAEIKTSVKRFEALENEHKLVMNGKLKIRH
jgi:hypothetical protein